MIGKVVENKDETGNILYSVSVYFEGVVQLRFNRELEVERIPIEGVREAGWVNPREFKQARQIAKGRFKRHEKRTQKK